MMAAKMIITRTGRLTREKVKKGWVFQLEEKQTDLNGQVSKAICLLATNSEDK
jgi:hypothetical protein